MNDESISGRDAVTRRTVLGGGCALLCTGAMRTGDGFVEVAPGAFVRRGVDAEATADNADAIGNAGFIVGGACVLVTDPGGSLADGRTIRTAIRRRTQRPITHVVIPHAHPDHLFGASAFTQDRPALIGHHRLAAMLTARGDYYRKRLMEVLGPTATGRVPLPTVAVRDPLAIDLGGRIVTITAQPRAHSDCDLTLVDRASGLLFASDLLFVGRMPALDGSLIGWLSVLATLGRSGAARAVPGHGPVILPFPAAAAPLIRYLTLLRDETQAAIAAGVPIDAATRTVAQSERSHWRLFDAYNTRNVTQAYKELEWT